MFGNFIVMKPVDGTACAVNKYVIATTIYIVCGKEM